LQAALKRLVNTEGQALRTLAIETTAQHSSALAENRALKAEMQAQADLIETLRAEIHGFNMEHRERNARFDAVQSENCFLRIEIGINREYMQAFVPKLAIADLSVCAAVKCINELVAIASELAVENRELLIKLDEWRGLRLRRVVGERDGLMLLVRELDRSNRMMAENIQTLMSRLPELGCEVAP